MARRRKTTDEPLEMATFPALGAPPADTITPPLSVIEARREEELESILDEIGSESRVKVWQVTDGKTSYAGEMSGAEFSLETLLDTFGGGDKTLAIYQGRQRVTTVKVSLDPTVPPKNPRLPKPVAGAPTPGTPDLNALLATMAANQMQSATMMTNMMTGMVGSMVQVLGAMKPGKDPMEIALEMAKVMKGGDGSSPADFLSALKQGMEIGERIGGGGEDADPVMSAVSKGLDTLGVIVNGVVEHNRASRQIPPAPSVPALPPGPAPPNPALVVAPTSTEEPPPVSGTIRPWVAAARPYINQLFASASFLPPVAAAAAINKNLDDDQFDDLLNDITDESGGGFSVRLQSYFPQATANTDPHWIGEVLTILLTDYVDEGDEPESAASSQPGDAP